MKICPPQADDFLRSAGVGRSPYLNGTAKIKVGAFASKTFLSLSVSDENNPNKASNFTSKATLLPALFVNSKTLFDYLLNQIKLRYPFDNHIGELILLNHKWNVMKSYKLLLLGLTITTVSSFIFSCKKSNDSPPALTISDTSQTVNESAGTASVTVNLSKTQSQNVKLNVQISGTAVLNGDYSVDSATSLTIPAGSTSAKVKFTIFNDGVVEGDKNIHVKFSSSANLTLTNTDATVIIKDNDVSQAANGLQTDLTWNAGSMVNLDLFLVDNVIIVNNEISDFYIKRGSTNMTGFETVPINNNDSDQVYYLAVYYNTGSRAVTYTITSNGPGVSNATATDNFAAADVGTAVFYGPITKVGSTYSRAQQEGDIFDISKMKSYPYRGSWPKR